jgi:hypothetical protein
LAELEATRASGKLAADGSFIFTGTNKGAIRTGNVAYVWGIDRSGHLGPGPFQGKPNISFDAVVEVSVSSSGQVKALVVDFDTQAPPTALPAGSVSIHGKTVKVTVPENLLPSTGLLPSQFRFNYWPVYNHAQTSFAPGAKTIQVGTI